jgi:hypothetical protein
LIKDPYLEVLQSRRLTLRRSLLSSLRKLPSNVAPWPERFNYLLTISDVSAFGSDSNSRLLPLLRLSAYKYQMPGSLVGSNFAQPRITEPLFCSSSFIPSRYESRKSTSVDFFIDIVIRSSALVSPCDVIFSERLFFLPNRRSWAARLAPAPKEPHPYRNSPHPYRHPKRPASPCFLPTSSRAPGSHPPFSSSRLRCRATAASAYE